MGGPWPMPESQAVVERSVVHWCMVHGGVVGGLVGGGAVVGRGGVGGGPLVPHVRHVPVVVVRGVGDDLDPAVGQRHPVLPGDHPVRVLHLLLGEVGARVTVLGGGMSPQAFPSPPSATRKLRPTNDKKRAQPPAHLYTKLVCEGARREVLDGGVVLGHVVDGCGGVATVATEVAELGLGGGEGGEAEGQDGGDLGWERVNRGFIWCSVASGSNLSQLSDQSVCPPSTLLAITAGWMCLSFISMIIVFLFCCAILVFLRGVVVSPECGGWR